MVRRFAGVRGRTPALPTAFGEVDDEGDDEDDEESDSESGEEEETSRGRRQHKGEEREAVVLVLPIDQGLLGRKLRR